MKLRYKTAIAAGLVGAVVMAAAAFGQDGSSSPAPKTGATQHAGKPGRLARRVVHSETKIQTPDGGFALVIVDRGEVTGVDGSTVTIKRPDGEAVSVTATDATRVRRDGEKANVGDVKTGDRAMLVQVDKDGTKTVRGIRAFSPGFQPRAGQRRMGRFNGGTPPPGTDAEASDAALFDPAAA